VDGGAAGGTSVTATARHNGTGTSRVGLALYVNGVNRGSQFWARSVTANAERTWTGLNLSDGDDLEFRAVEVGSREAVLFDRARVDGTVTEPPAADSDGDGVPDSSDRCPGFPDSADADGDGTPDGCDAQDNRDSDGDGVQNYQDACPAVAGPASNNGCPESEPPLARYDVRDFGATPNDASDDTAAFESAMARAAQAGGAAYAQNIHIEGVGGNFTIDLYDAGQETAGIRYRNVRGFSLRNMVCIQNNDNPTQEAPSSRRPCISFLPTPAGGDPIDGELENIHSQRSPYGWGLTQISGGENLRFFDISSEGGVPLRLESLRDNWTPIDNLVADGVRCKNGHDAVHMNPHGAQHGKVTIQNVVADSCESALSLKTDEVLGGSFGADSSITGVTVIPGNQAQLRDDAKTGYVGAWVIGPSRWCIDNDDPLGYTIGLSNVDCGGLSNRRP
jgi:hypothetical protein